MSARTQHGWVAVGLLTILLAACSSPSSVGDVGSPPPSPSMPAVSISGLRAERAPLAADVVSKEAVHPDDFLAELTRTGFAGGTEDSLTGAHGVFSRVVIRGWSFVSEQGAAAFLEWLQSNAAELIGDAAPITAALPAGVTLQLHSPTGCCHEEVPIYLATWQRGTTVWTIRASGARIHAAPVVALVTTVEKET